MKLIALVISCVSFFPAFGQEKLPSVFENFGFIVSMDYDHLKLSTGSWQTYKIDDEINSLTSDDKFGFSLGLAYFIELNNNFTLRPLSLISFNTNKLKYDFVFLNDHQEPVQPVTLELPVHLIYTNRKDKYFMPSLILGLRTIYDISNKKKGQKLILEKSNFAFDIGGGLDVHGKSFSMRPELIISLGMRNVNTFQNDIYHKAISGLVREKISVSVSFYQNK